MRLPPYAAKNSLKSVGDDCRLPARLVRVVLSPTSIVFLLDGSGHTARVRDGAYGFLINETEPRKLAGVGGRQSAHRNHCGAKIGKR